MTLKIWAAGAALTLIIDLGMMHRRLSGAMGEQVRSRYRYAADRVGGVLVLVGVTLVADLLLWPLALGACAFGYVTDRRGGGR